MNNIQPEKTFGSILFPMGIMLVLFALLLPVTHVGAQESGWSYPKTIPSFDLNFPPPILIADRNGTVHAFSSQSIQTKDGGLIRAIVYNEWTLETSWTPPTDVLLSPYKEARVTDAYLDDEGYVHVAFWGGDGIGADIYYSKALLAEAGNARSWSKPNLIGEDAGDPEGAVFYQNNQGKLFVIFNGRKYGNGLYVVSSDDHGNSWSFPIPVFTANNEAPNLFNLRVIKSESGWLHAIWNMYSVNGQGRTIYYARSVDGEAWDQPTVFAEAQEGLGTQTPTIIEHDGALFAFYNLPPKIIMQRSVDNGETWEDPVILFPRHVGVNGSLAPVLDANNTLHLFFGQRIPGSPDIHGMWQSTWLNQRWSEPEALIKGPRIVDNVGNKGFDPYGARAVLVQGNSNIFLVTWITDPGNIKPNGVWYSTKLLYAPEAPALPRSTPGTSEVPTQNIPNPEVVSPPSVLLLTPENPPARNSESDPEATTSSNLILFATIPLVLLVVLVIKINSSKRNKN